MLVTSETDVQCSWLGVLCASSSPSNSLDSMAQELTKHSKSCLARVIVLVKQIPHRLEPAPVYQSTTLHGSSRWGFGSLAV